MPYVSCMYAPPDPTGMAEAKPAGQLPITCIDDQGRTWWLTEDSQVGDWLDYVANGGKVTPYRARASAKPAPQPVPESVPEPAPAPVDQTAADLGTVYGEPLPE